MSSMFSMRGNRMSLWIADDNFVVDDSSATFTEVPFLSMDLHSLASKLETLDVSQRLFIEADIFPGQLDVDKSEETNVPESEKVENCASGPNEQCLDENKFLRHSSNSTATSHCSLLPDPRQRAMLVDQGRKDMPSSTTRSSILVQTLPSEVSQVTSLMNPVKDDLKQMEQSSLGEVVDSIAQINLNDVEDSKEKSSTFEAMAAEAELDMLLNSFGETKFLDTSGISKKSANNLPVERDDSTSLSKENTAGKQLSDKSSKSARNIPVSVDIDCTIDDLLKETSNPNVQNNALPPQKGVVPPYVPASSSNSKVLLDDFDSWLDTI
ncbi:hypothetical protein IFM89_014389 [Coptis chinensis]|uniref:Uncharacterized protein n=1 Tax=Coptis chinensis TaxID=261450 RepID=A0A835LAY3_9MAGN|nr:hypothetical protein IFM89_014389 [Coptis chinensis]